MMFTLDGGRSSGWKNNPPDGIFCNFRVSQSVYRRFKKNVRWTQEGSRIVKCPVGQITLMPLWLYRKKNAVSKLNLTSIYFYVFLPVAPESLDLTGPTEARVGEILTYSCMTANSNPPATIQWIVGNVTRQALTTYTKVSPLGGWVTFSNISVSLEPYDRNKIVICSARNSELNEVKTESKMLSVICEYYFNSSERVLIN